MTQANNISSQLITSKPSYAPTMTLAMAQKRAQFISSIRQFFASRQGVALRDIQSVVLGKIAGETPSVRHPAEVPGLPMHLHSTEDNTE